MKILIVGANGQLGTELQEILKQNRCREGELPPQFRNAEIVAASSSILDITDYEKTHGFIAEHRPQLLLNCAAYTAVDKAEFEEERCMSINRDAAAFLAKVCFEWGIKYVYPSSESVFGGEQTVPYTESDQTCPKNVYGRSKLSGEQLVSEACPTSLILRAGWLYGFYGRNFVKTIAQRTAQQEYLSVVNDQYGNPTNVDVFCLHMFQLLDKGASGVFHCVDQGVITRYEYAKEIAEILGHTCVITPCTTEDYPSPTPRSKYMGMDCGKMRCFLNADSRNWRDVLVDFLDEAKKRGVLT